MTIHLADERIVFHHTEMIEHAMVKIMVCRGYALLFLGRMAGG